MTKKNLGILLIVFPVPLLIATLAAFAVFSFVIGSMASSGDVTNLAAMAAIVRVVLGFVGVIAVLGMLVGIPVGIYLVISANRGTIGSKRQDPKFASLSDEDFNFVTGASLGAFLSPFVWAIANGLYLDALLSLVPFYGIYEWIKLTVYGKRMSWETGKFATVAAFRKRQLIALIIGTLISVLGVASQVMDSGNKPATHADSPFASYLCTLSKDTDGDTLPDIFEGLAGTDKTKADTDGDGYSDAQELANGHQASPTILDKDVDGLPDLIESAFYGTRPSVADSDSDGVNDGAEVQAKTNPAGAGPAPDFLKKYLDGVAKTKLDAGC